MSYATYKKAETLQLRQPNKQEFKYEVPRAESVGHEIILLNAHADHVRRSIT